jgi:hypothetical protein
MGPNQHQTAPVSSVCSLATRGAQASASDDTRANCRGKSINPLVRRQYASVPLGPKFVHYSLRELAPSDTRRWNFLRLSNNVGPSAMSMNDDVGTNTWPLMRTRSATSDGRGTLAYHFCQQVACSIVVAATIIETLNGPDLRFPVVEGEALTKLNKVRRVLLAERGSCHY